MSKGLRIFLLAVLAASVFLVYHSFQNYQQLNRRLRADELTLSESRSSWETIAAEKEALQDELKLLKNELKEQELTLEESTGRAAELQQEIDQLKTDIDTLRNTSADPG